LTEVSGSAKYETINPASTIQSRFALAAALLTAKDPTGENRKNMTVIAEITEPTIPATLPHRMVAPRKTAMNPSGR